jgi:hypothetical protein
VECQHDTENKSLEKFVIYLKGIGGFPAPKHQYNELIKTMTEMEFGKDQFFKFDNGIMINLSEIAAIDALIEEL